MQEILALCASIFLGGLVQGLTGFGSVLVTLPLLSLAFELRTAIPLIALFAQCINLWLLVELRRHLSAARLGLLLLATVPGIPVGVWALKVFPEWVLSLLVGLMLLAFALHSLLVRPRPRTLGRGWTALAGFLAGILGGSTGANGPPIIVYAAMQPWTKDEAKSLMTGYFFFAGLAVVSLHALSGLTTLLVLRHFVTGLPALVAGVFLGSSLYRRLGGAGYRTAVLLLLLILGGFTVLRAVAL